MKVLPFVAGVWSLLCASWAVAAADVQDPLVDSTFPGRGSQGGTYSAEGWTTTGPTDSVWYEMPDALPAGRVEYSVRGVSTATTLTGADHDLLAIYQAPTGIAEPVGYSPEFRNNDMKVFTRIFGQVEGAPRTGAMKLEFVLCPRGEPWYHDTDCPAGCVGNLIGYANGSPTDIGWDGTAWYRMAVWWGNGMMRFSRDGVELGGVDYAGSYAPGPVRVRIGSPRHGISPDAVMPVGLTFKDVVITGEPGPQSPICEAAPDDAGIADAAPEDATACDPSSPIAFGGIAPASGTGVAQTFRVRFTHCEGASAFRVVQLLAGDAVDPGLPALAVGYEGGMLYVGDGSQACAPGENKVLGTPYGGLDCSSSSAAATAGALVVDWSLLFDPSSFAGDHLLFVDAKGGSSTPESRLGWTDVGSWTVAAAPDAGVTTDASAGWPDGSASGPDGSQPNGLASAPSGDDAGDCACRAAGKPGSRPAGVAAVAALLAVALARRAFVSPRRPTC